MPMTSAEDTTGSLPETKIRAAKELAEQKKSDLYLSRGPDSSLPSIAALIEGFTQLRDTCESQAKEIEYLCRDNKRLRDERNFLVHKYRELQSNLCKLKEENDWAKFLREQPEQAQVSTPQSASSEHKPHTANVLHSPIAKDWPQAQLRNQIRQEEQATATVSATNSLRSRAGTPYVPLSTSSARTEVLSSYTEPSTITYTVYGKNAGSPSIHSIAAMGDVITSAPNNSYFPQSQYLEQTHLFDDDTSGGSRGPADLALKRAQQLLNDLRTSFQYPPASSSSAPRAQLESLESAIRDIKEDLHYEQLGSSPMTVASWEQHRPSRNGMENASPESRSLGSALVRAEQLSAENARLRFELAMAQSNMKCTSPGAPSHSMPHKAQRPISGATGPSIDSKLAAVKSHLAQLPDPSKLHGHNIIKSF